MSGRRFSRASQSSSNGMNCCMVLLLLMARRYRRRAGATKANGPVRTMTESGRLRATWSESVDFDHLEVVLGRPAVRARPGVGHVGPAGARLEAFFGQTQRLVIDEAADDTHPFAKGAGFVGA